METIFHIDPRMAEWTKQITEKILTVNLLTGADSSAEFQKGCQIVTKLGTLLLGLASFPPGYLEDGVRQLVEQQLPDARVINNFPSFYDIMNRMVHEGISRIEPQTETVIFSEKVPECDKAQVFGQVTVNIDMNNGLVATEARLKEVRKGDNEEENVPDEIPKRNLPSQEPHHEDVLKHVMSFVFSGKSINWHFKCLNHTFLAQIENILIYVQEPNQLLDLKIYHNEGWKIIVLDPDDLNFPRRLERRVRYQQLGKKL